MDEYFSLILLLILLLLTSFFVISEFAIVKIRKSRIEVLEKQGVKNAKKLSKIIGNLDSYLSACQLGITITSLGIGWLGEPAVASLLLPVFQNFDLNDTLIHTISFIISFLTVTFLHVVLGELVPKAFAIQKAEKISLNIAAPLDFFHQIMYPFIKALNGTALFLARFFGLKPNHEDDSVTEEEIKHIIAKSNDINSDEKELVKNIFDFDETTVNEVMVHRKSIDFLYINKSIEENLAIAEKSPHTRFPVCGEDKDDVLGYVNLKDLYVFLDKEKGLRSVLRKIPKIFEGLQIKTALKKLQQEKSQIGIVFDEYGGVSGLISVEDILEKIVGEIQDELDNESPNIRKTRNGWLVDGETSIDEFEEKFGVQLEEQEGIYTVGGFLLSYLENNYLDKRETIDIDNMKFQILKTIDNKKIELVKVNVVNAQT